MRGWGLVSNLKEHRSCQLARTADHMTRPRGEDRERDGMVVMISSGSSVVLLDTGGGVVCMLKSPWLL